MAFKEVSVVQVREVLRRWLRGDGTRRAASGAGVDRKTARGIVERAQARGLVRVGSEDQLTDELLLAVEADGAPGNRGERGETWRRCEENREFLAARLSEGLTLTKTAELLARHTGAPVPYRTLHRFATRELGFAQQAPTVRMDDCAPGHEVQMDFGRLGTLTCDDGARRPVWALIFTAVHSRHMYVWLGHDLDLEAVIAGSEAAWRAFGGVFRVVIPDNLKPVVTKADRLNARISDDFLAYAQSRGFEVEPTRVKSPKDKPRVERTVRYTRDSFWAGEAFKTLAEAQAAADAWCERVGRRLHDAAPTERGARRRGAPSAAARPDQPV
jgi:transposase